MNLIYCWPIVAVAPSRKKLKDVEAKSRVWMDHLDRPAELALNWREGNLYYSSQRKPVVTMCNIEMKACPKVFYPETGLYIPVNNNYIEEEDPDFKLPLELIDRRSLWYHIEEVFPDDCDDVVEAVVFEDGEENSCVPIKEEEMEAEEEIVVGDVADEEDVSICDNVNEDKDSFLGVDCSLGFQCEGQCLHGFVL